MVKNFFLYLLIPILISFIFVLKDHKMSDFFKKKSSNILKFDNQKFLKEVDLLYFSYEKKIKDKAFLNFTEDKNKNLTLLINNWINFYQQETGNFIDLISSITENDFTIIDLKINKKEDINKSIIDEYNFFQSIKETIENTFLEIKHFYFFEDEKLLIGENIFLNKNFEIINFEDEKEEDEKEEENNKKKYLLIPLNKNKKSEKILKVISKNFFQEINTENNNLLLINNIEPYSEIWCRKLKNLNKEENENKIIFLNVYEGNKNKISLILNENLKNKTEKNINLINLLEEFSKNQGLKIQKVFFECKANTLFENSLIIEIEIKTEEFFEEIKKLLKII